MNLYALIEAKTGLVAEFSVAPFDGRDVEHAAEEVVRTYPSLDEQEGATPIEKIERVGLRLVPLTDELADQYEVAT
jgi:hypothetical protein